MNYTNLIIGVLGGLAIFVYGMGLMSEGLTRIAGPRLKSVLSYITRNRFFAILAGAGVTALIQSSSAMSVMTVGFVNAGLLSLEQAIGVIFGANIGTTITGQIVSFKLDAITLPAIILGVLTLTLVKRDLFKGIGRTILGFGLLFYGMALMSNELKVVAGHPSFIGFFSHFDCTPGASGYLPIGSVLGAIAVGTLCTMLVQSSSATIGITIALAESGILSIWTAVPIVLGDNIGTTITAGFAALNANANARRTALAHALFNVLGSLLLLASFSFVWRASSGIAAPLFYHLVDAVTSGNGLAGANPGRYVAMAHTLFNVTNVIILSFFIPFLARFCRWIIREEPSRQTHILEPRLLGQPAFALGAVRHALIDMTRRSWTVASVALNCYLGRATVDEESVLRAERMIDSLQNEMSDYLIGISRSKLTDRQAQLIPELLHCVNDAERISDLAVKIYRKSPRAKETILTPEVSASIVQVVAQTRKLANQTISALRTGYSNDEKIFWREKEIREAIHNITRIIGQNLALESADPQNDIPLVAVLSALNDIARHLGNIAERISFLSLV